MKTRTVKRYWCDFCKKAGAQRHSMQKHEDHCGLNPARKCRMCALIVDGMDHDDYEAKRPLADLIAMLPDPTEYLASMQFDGDPPGLLLEQSMVEIMPAFRRAAGNCPACMLAALRQKKIYVSMAPSFNFKTESAQIFADLNDQRADERGY